VLAALGIVHVVLTFVQYDSPTLDALWFLGSGFFVLVSGGLNVVAARSGSVATQLAPGVQTVTLVANGAGVVLAGAFVWMTDAQQPQGPILLALFLCCAALLASRRRRESPGGRRG
jgi:hypothetical protein